MVRSAIGALLIGHLAKKLFPEYKYDVSHATSPFLIIIKLYWARFIVGGFGHNRISIRQLL